MVRRKKKDSSGPGEGGERRDLLKRHVGNKKASKSMLIGDFL